MITNENEIKEQTVHNLIILDESGSMGSIRKQALSGANETIMTIRNSQKSMPDLRHRLSFVTFDSRSDGKDVRTIIDDMPIDEVRDLTEEDYQPMGCTPLYDAMGLSLAALQQKVKADEHVLVTIITDGLENASHEYSGKAIKSIVGLLREKGWVFAYIGANQDAVEVASELNINNAMNYEATPTGYAHMVSESNKSSMRCYKKFQQRFLDAGEKFFENSDDEK